jgi:multidrug resistance efflux pump
VLKSAAYSLKASQQRLEYQEEELRQLEEMYKADDLTEETEEIVLKRARNSVDAARFMHEIAKVNYDLAMKFQIPRRDETAKAAVEQAEISWQSARSTLPITLKKTQLDLAKAKIDRRKSEQKLEKLLADRAAMVVKAPVSGVVYYGQCADGRWSSAAITAKKLRLGGTITPHEVVMTIVQTRPMFVHTTLAEKDLAKVRAGDPCQVVPTSDPDIELAASVGEIGTVPVDAKKFDMRVSLSGKLPASLVPGMSCQVKFAVAEQPQDKPDEAQEEAGEAAEKAAPKKND